MSQKQSFTREELLMAGNGLLFGEKAGRLPLPNMLMVDRITMINDDGGKYGKGVIIGELDITPDLWFFACHFKGDPVMPGTLGLDALFQLTGFYLGYKGFPGKGRALGCESLKFFGQVLPTNKIVKYVIDIKRIINLKLTMILADGSLFVDDEQIYSVESMKVGLFE